VFDGSYITSN